MMLTNPYTLWVIAQARQDELLADVRMRQMWHQAAETERRKPKFWQKLSWQLGGSMIAVGHRLQTQEQLK